MNEVLDIHEAADLLHIAPSTLKRHARAGTVPARKLGARWVFSRARLVAFVDSGQAPKGRDEADQMPRPHKSRLREKVAILESRREAA